MTVDDAYEMLLIADEADAAGRRAEGCAIRKQVYEEMGPASLEASLLVSERDLKLRAPPG